MSLVWLTTKTSNKSKTKQLKINLLIVLPRQGDVCNRHWESEDSYPMISHLIQPIVMKKKWYCIWNIRTYIYIYKRIDSVISKGITTQLIALWSPRARFSLNWSLPFCLGHPKVTSSSTVSATKYLGCNTND